MRKNLTYILVSLFFFVSCCDNKKPNEGDNITPPISEGQIQSEGEGILNPPQEGTIEGETALSFWPNQHPFTLTYRIVSKYPHDSTAFTQGLIWNNGILYESTGLYGKSTIRIVELETGIPTLLRSLPEEYNGQTFNKLFGEGIAIVDNFTYQLTWKEGICFVYSKDKLELQRVLYYTGEGWGLTYDGNHLIMSDGSAYLYFRDTETFKIVKTILVKEGENLISQLNELEFIDGYICANVWYRDYAVVIHPGTGEVVGKIELYNLKNQLSNSSQADVLNGIAYRSDNNHLLVTGKYWDTLFEIELLPQRAY